MPRSLANRLRPLLAAALVASLHLTAPDSAWAATHTVNAATVTVNPGDPCPSPMSAAVYKTVQKAVDCATLGDTTNVAAGTYNELVTVGKSLNLRGAKAGVDASTRSGPESVLN